jgi:hypothetical protein
MEPDRLPALQAIGRGAPLRLGGQILFRSEAPRLVIGRTFYVASFGALDRYRLDDGKLTLIAQYDFDVVGAELGQRDGAPYMKTKAGAWARIDPETGGLTPIAGQAPPPVAGAETVIGERRFSVDRARRGFAIARGAAAEAFVLMDTVPALFVARSPEGERLVLWPDASAPAALLEVTPDPPVAAVGKLCGELIWFWGKGISDQPFSLAETPLSTGARGGFEVWLPASRRVPRPAFPPDSLRCAGEGREASLSVPNGGGLLLGDAPVLWDAGLHQTFAFNCEVPVQPGAQEP